MSNTDTGDPNNINKNEKNLLSSSSSPRESLITTAINFLKNPNIIRHSLLQKQKFLRSKGLTEDEIQIACERAGIFTIDPNSTIISMDINTSSSSDQSHLNNLSSSSPSQNYYQLVQKPTFFNRIKDILNSAVLFGSLAYACYLFYKRFIEPFLFRNKRKKTVEDTIQEANEKIEIKIKEINQEIIRVREEITRNNQNEIITKEFINFKNDLDTIKGLLLNKKQFGNSMPVLPSIPAWQLTSQSHHTEPENEPDKNDDAGSGSGSSETEVVTKNSDSSLELM